MSNLVIDANGHFEFGGENFVVDMSARDRRPSNDEAFTIVKSDNYLRFYESLAANWRPSGIFELGIFQGGSYVFLDKLLKPERMSAVDISDKPVVPLLNYIARTPGRFAHFATSQTDGDKLRGIVQDELGGKLDLVVDDASHAYEHTKASFEILFPLLRPNGIYVIEDWAWAHNAAYQVPNAPFAYRPALTTLLFEQIALLGSTVQISEIRIRKPLYMVRKSAVATVGDRDVWTGVMTRGRKLHPI